MSSTPKKKHIPNRGIFEKKNLDRSDDKSDENAFQSPEDSNYKGNSQGLFLESENSNVFSDDNSQKSESNSFDKKEGKKKLKTNEKKKGKQDLEESVEKFKAKKSPVQQKKSPENTQVPRKNKATGYLAEKSDDQIDNSISSNENAHSKNVEKEGKRNNFQQRAKAVEQKKELSSRKRFAEEIKESHHVQNQIEEDEQNVFWRNQKTKNKNNDNDLMDEDICFRENKNKTFKDQRINEQSVNKKTDLMEANRSKSSNKVFRRIGDANSPINSKNEEESPISNNSGSKIRALSRYIPKNKEDNTFEDNRALFKKKIDFSQTQKVTPDNFLNNKINSITGEKESRKIENGNETDLNAKIQRILEFGRSKSPYALHKKNEKQGKKISDSIQEVKNQSRHIADLQNENDFDEIDLRVHEKNAFHSEFLPKKIKIKENEDNSSEELSALRSLRRKKEGRLVKNLKKKKMDVKNASLNPDDEIHKEKKESREIEISTPAHKSFLKDPKHGEINHGSTDFNKLLSSTNLSQKFANKSLMLSEVQVENEIHSPREEKQKSDHVVPVDYRTLRQQRKMKAQKEIEENVSENLNQDSKSPEFDKKEKNEQKIKPKNNKEMTKSVEKKVIEQDQLDFEIDPSEIHQIGSGDFDFESIKKKKNEHKKSNLMKFDMDENLLLKTAKHDFGKEIITTSPLKKSQEEKNAEMMDENSSDKEKQKAKEQTPIRRSMLQNSTKKFPRKRTDDSNSKDLHSSFPVNQNLLQNEENLMDFLPENEQKLSPLKNESSENNLFKDQHFKESKLIDRKQSDEKTRGNKNDKNKLDNESNPEDHAKILEEHNLNENEEKEPTQKILKSKPEQKNVENTHKDENLKKKEVETKNKTKETGFKHATGDLPSKPVTNSQFGKDLSTKNDILENETAIVEQKNEVLYEENKKPEIDKVEILNETKNRESDENKEELLNQNIKNPSSIGTGGDRPIKSKNVSEYNFDDPNFVDTYVPSNKAKKKVPAKLVEEVSELNNIESQKMEKEIIQKEAIKSKNDTEINEEDQLLNFNSKFVKKDPMKKNQEKNKIPENEKKDEKINEENKNSLEKLKENEKLASDTKIEEETLLQNQIELPKKPFPKNKFSGAQKKTPLSDNKSDDPAIVIIAEQKDEPLIVKEQKKEEIIETSKSETIRENIKKNDPVPIEKNSEKSDIPAKVQEIEEEKQEDPNSLTAKIKSANFKVRQEAYAQIATWNNPEVTPEVFAKNLQNYLKDKHPLSIEALLIAVDSFFDKYPQVFQMVDLKSVIESIAENLLSNVKGASKEKALVFIVRLWEMSNFDLFLEQLNLMLVSNKPKRQEAVLTIVMELLKNSKVDEMKQIKPLWPEIGKLINSRTISLKNQTMELYKEAYLWIGDAIRPFLKDLKKIQMDELDSYFRGIEPSKMRKVEKKAKVETTNIPQTVKSAETKPTDSKEENIFKSFNTVEWVTKILAMKTAKDQAKQIIEFNEKLSKSEKLTGKIDFTPLMNLFRKVLVSIGYEAKIACSQTWGLLAEKVGRDFNENARELHKLLFPKIAEKELIESYMINIGSLHKILALADVLQDFKYNLEVKNSDLILQTLIVIKNVLETSEKCVDSEKSLKLSELVIKFADEKNTEIKNVSHQILGSQLAVNEAKILPLLKPLSSSSTTNINQISSSVKLCIKASMVKEDENESDQKIARSNTKSNVQRIIQIREDCFGNKIIKTSDVKNFPNHLFKNMNFLVEITSEFKNLFPEETSEIITFVEIMIKVEKLSLSEAARVIIIHFFVERFNEGYSEQIQACFDQFYTFSMKSMSNKVFVSDTLNLLSKKQIKLNKEFFQVILGLFEKEIASQSMLATLNLKLLTDFMKLQFGSESIQIVFKTMVINTMRLLIKKFGNRCVDEFPSILLDEFDAINEAQKVFEKIIDKLSDKNPERKKAALIDLANYNDPSTILTFWSNDKFITFLKRQMTVETKNTNYIVLIKILDHYLDIRSISFADFNIKTYIYIFHAVLMNYYDGKEDSHLREIEALIKKSVQALTPNVILNEMINSDSNSLSWKEQVLNFMNEYAEEVEPTIKIMNYLIQIVGIKNLSKEFSELLHKIFLRFKNTQNPEILSKGNENKSIREIWQKNEEDVIINADFVKGQLIFEDTSLFKKIKEFLMKNLKIEEKNFYARNIESIDFKSTETSFKTKMAYWFIRSVENNSRNNDFIIRQMYINESYRDDEISLVLATKIVLTVLQNLFHYNTEMYFDNAFRLMGQIGAFLGENGLDTVMNYLDLDVQEYEFFQMILDQAQKESEEHRIGMTHFQKTAPNTKADLSLPIGVPSRTPVLQKDQFVNYENPAIKMKKNNQNQEREYEYDNNFTSAQKQAMMSGNSYPGERVSADPSTRQALGQNQRMKSQNPAQEAPSLENYGVLQEIFSKMHLFDIDEFKIASDYFIELCSSKKQISLTFLIEYGGEIIDNFIQIFDTIFNQGINFGLLKSNYELIFVPLLRIFEKENFLVEMSREKILSICEFVINKFILANEEKKELDSSDKQSYEITEYIVKTWNSLLIRTIDNSNPNHVVSSLFYLINNCPKTPQNKIVESEINLALKCLLRITKNFANFVDRLDPVIVLSSINAYLKKFNIQNSELLGTKVVKGLLTDFVTLTDPDILMENYEILFKKGEDSTLLRMITAIQNKKNDESRLEDRSVRQFIEGQSQLIELINDFNKQPNSVQMKNYFSRFQKLISSFPHLRIKEYEDYFNSREQFAKIVKSINYFSMSSNTDAHDNANQIGNPVKNPRTIVAEPKSLQGIMTPLSSAKVIQSGRKIQQQQEKSKNRTNFNDISEIRDRD